ncbi:hypothetical protein [Okeania sp. SIO2B3]|uniref:hypothetical protein n=1 Tax=Okeania sp. SIO2B3 TaxID=2607784 RepID=UPI0013C1D705|nr:hypothetical protein [Okeania sp. SIO2B3]NET41150.1 hypothetical protein [Okeania sp. SIO2B3]
MSEEVGVTIVNLGFFCPTMRLKYELFEGFQRDTWHCNLTLTVLKPLYINTFRINQQALNNQSLKKEEGRRKRDKDY